MDLTIKTMVEDQHTPILGFWGHDYGVQHHENLFTKFAMAHWPPKNSGIDKRGINLSGQVLSGAITRDQAARSLRS